MAGERAPEASQDRLIRLVIGTKTAGERRLSGARYIIGLLSRVYDEPSNSATEQDVLARLFELGRLDGKRAQPRLAEMLGPDRAQEVLLSWPLVRALASGYERFGKGALSADEAEDLHIDAKAAVLLGTVNEPLWRLLGGQTVAAAKGISGREPEDVMQDMLTGLLEKSVFLNYEPSGHLGRLVKYACTIARRRMFDRERCERLSALGEGDPPSSRTLLRYSRRGVNPGDPVAVDEERTARALASRHRRPDAFTAHQVSHLLRIRWSTFRNVLARWRASGNAPSISEDRRKFFSKEDLQNLRLFVESGRPKR